MKGRAYGNTGGAYSGWGRRSREPRAFLNALGLALIVFAGLLLVLGKDPIATYITIYNGTLGDSYGWGEIVVKMIPFMLCALATAIPAKVGLVNVGGEGQIYLGAWLATWVALSFGGIPGPILIPALIVAGCLGGALSISSSTARGRIPRARTGPTRPSSRRARAWPRSGARGSALASSWRSRRWACTTG
jgi:hypothetical protein